MEQNISAVEVYSLLKFCSKIKNKFYYISRNITINKCQVNRLIERIERFMQTLDEVLNNKPQLTFGTLNKIKQLKDLFLRIGGHLNSYLRYGYLRRLLHPLEQEREFIFYTDQLCSIAQFFGFYLIDGKQRLLEDEEDQLIDFAEFTQVLESVQGNDAKLLSFLGLDVDPSALPEVLNALENAIQMNGISSNKIVTIDLNNEHFLSNTRILTFINNQLTQINRYLINNGHNPPIEESKSSVPSPYVDTTYTKINYDYLKPITSVVVNDGKNLSQDSLAHSNNTNNSKSKNLTDFLGMNENNKSKHHSRSRSRSRKGTSSQPNQHIHHSHSHSHGRSLSLSFNLSKNHSHNHSHNRSRSRSHIDEEDSDFYTETDLQRQQRQMRKALTEVYSNGSINHSDNIDSIASPSPIKGRIISNKNTGNNPLQINTNIRVTTRKSSPIPFSMTRKVINSDDSPINLNILEFVDSDDSDEDERGRKRQTVGYIKNQGLITPAGSTPNTPKSAPLYFDSPYFTRREIQASKLENNCLIIDTQLQLKSVYYELVRISGGQVGFYVKQAWKIPFWDMELWDIIESTLISKIYRGLWHFTEVAVKEIDIPLETPELQQQFQSYVENWYSLRHPHIIPLLGASITHNIPYVVMPFLSKGNLVQYLENNLDIPHLISIILDISSGMQYLHSRQLIHGELMASNILIDNYGEPSICDLGFSKYFYFSSLSNNKSTNSTMEDGQSTLIRTNNSYINRKINRYIRWTANEIQDNYIYTFASDVYSFGMLCYEIFSGGDVPFSDIPENIIPEAVKSGRRPSRPSGCPDEIWSLMQKCWDINPDKRPTFYEISQNLMQIKTHYKIIYSNTEMILPNNTQVHSPSQSLNTSITMNNNNIPSWLAIPDYSYTNINLDSKSNHNSYLGLGQGLSQGQGQSEDQGQKQEQGQDQGFLHTMENQTQEQAYSHRRSNSVNYSKPSNVSNINMNLQINDNSISRNSNDLSISNSYSSGYSSPKNSINRSSFHENIKYPVISGINSQKISPYMKAALMNSSLLPNNINISSNNASDNNNDNNNNSSNNKSNNKNNDITLNNDNNNNNLNNLPIINLNLNNKNNGQFNYLQQLMNDEENSNINRFNESRVTNIPLSPSTTTDSDEINDSLNRYHSLTTKNEINIQTKKGGHLKSSLSLNNIPSLNSNTNRYHHSRTSSINFNNDNNNNNNNNNNNSKSTSYNTINKNVSATTIDTTSGINLNLGMNTSHESDTINTTSEVRKGSLDSYQSSYSENENNSKTDLQKRNINSSCTKKVEVEDVEQYIKKHLITKDNIPVDLDLNNEQFIQQIEHLDMSNNFSNKRNSENQQSKVYIDKVLRKVSSIKKEYENPISSNNSSSTSFSYLKHSSFPSTFSDQGQGQGQEQGQEQRLGQGQEQDQGQDQVTFNQIQYYNKLLSEKIKVVSPRANQQQRQYSGDNLEGSGDLGKKRNSVSSFKRNTIISNSSSSLDSPILLQGQQGSSLTTTTIQSSNTIHSTGNAKTPQIEALSQLTQQLKRASFQLLLEAQNETTATYSPEEVKEFIDKDEIEEIVIEDSNDDININDDINKKVNVGIDVSINDNGDGDDKQYLSKKIISATSTDMSLVQPLPLKRVSIQQLPLNVTSETIQAMSRESNTETIETPLNSNVQPINIYMKKDGFSDLSTSTSTSTSRSVGTLSSSYPNNLSNENEVNIKSVMKHHRSKSQGMLYTTSSEDIRSILRPSRQYSNKYSIHRQNTSLSTTSTPMTKSVLTNANINIIKNKVTNMNRSSINSNKQNTSKIIEVEGKSMITSSSDKTMTIPASTNTNTTTEVSQSNKTEEDSNQTTVGTSKIVGILKISNSNSNSASNAHVDIDNSNGNDGHSKSGPTESIMEKSNHLSSSVNTNSVRFALDDDYANKSLDEFDIKGMTSDNLDHIANLLMNEESDTKFETNQQILFHKKRLKELINELRYRIGDNQVDECIKEDTIEINTYSWSDLSFKRTSIRILIDIIKHTFAKSVILKDCRFSDLAAKCIAMAVKKNPFIKRLDITFCSKWARTQTDPITNILNYDSARYDSTWVLSKLVGPKSASAFANMLQVNTSLKVLQLRNASFGDTGVALIAKALQNNYVLEKLEIDNCCTAEYGSHAIAEALKVNTSLQVLNLSQNSLSDKGGIAIIEALQENHTLKALVLHRCTLSSSKFCDSFSKTLSINDSILEIDLGSNSFSKDGIKYIAEGLSHNQTLEVLKLEDCNLSKKCVSILSKALDNENNKTELHLGSVLKFWDKKELFNKRILFHKEQFA
jgi:hypothetical protein